MRCESGTLLLDVSVSCYALFGFSFESKTTGIDLGLTGFCNQYFPILRLLFITRVCLIDGLLDPISLMRRLS
jgi:hypothetical protein